MSKADELRARIIEEAIAHFAERGFEGTSVALIAESVGISKQRLLYHFKTKQELRVAALHRIDATFQKYNGGLLTSLANAGADGEDPVDAVVARLAEHRDASRVVLRELMSGDPLVASVLGESFDRRHRLSDRDDERRAALQCAGLLALVLSAVHTGRRRLPRAYLTIVRNLLRDGLTRPASGDSA